jgi:hypothetical protein
LYDPRNPFSLPFLDRTHTTFLDWPELCNHLKFGDKQFSSSVDPVKVRECLERHQLWADNGGFTSGRFHTNLTELVRKARDWGEDHEWPDPVEKLLSTAWENRIRAVVKTRAGIKWPLFFDPSVCDIITINDDQIQSSNDLKSKLHVRDLGSTEKPQLLVVKCSSFSLLHHAHLKFLLDKFLDWVTKVVHGVIILLSS